MRMLSLIVAFLASGALAVYVLTCSVNDTPPAPVHPIVGKWVRTESDGIQASPDSIETTEFTADGKIIHESVDPKNGYCRAEGTYTAKGSELEIVWLDRDASQNKFSSIIASISSNRFTGKGVEISGETSGVSTYSRLHGASE